MTEWDMLYRWILEKQKVEGYLKEEVRKMSQEEVFQLVLKLAEVSWKETISEDDKRNISRAIFNN